MRSLGLAAFLLFAAAGSRAATIRTLSIPADGRTPVTPALQKAINETSAAGGGVIALPAGVYLCGSVSLRNNTTLRLEKGALLLGSTNVADYAKAESRGKSLVYAENATNVTIEGEGVIDGRGFAFPEKTTRRRPMVAQFVRCRNVRLRGVTLKDSALWTCFFEECDGVEARRVTINSHANFNNDGFDIDSRNVLIADCVIDSDDDAICFKSHNPAFAVEHATVRNCRISSNCNFIKFGTASHGAFRDITVRDCALVPCSRSILRFWEKKRLPGVTAPITGLAAIALEVVDGGSMENVAVSNITFRGAQTPILVRFGRRVAAPGTFLRNVLIQNVSGQAESLIASSITGVPGLRVNGVTLRNLDLKLKAGGKVSDTLAVIPEQEKAYPENRMFKARMLPGYAFYIRHADNIRMKNVRATFSGGREERPAVFTDDTTGIQFDRCSFQKPDGALATFLKK